MADVTLPASIVDAVEAHLAEQAAVDAAAELTGGKNGPVDRRSRSTAAVILDVLRASGWIDPQEGDQLRKELDRLRELLNQVVRDHRTREAEAARTQAEQLNWLVPLVRAAHGMDQGTLEAKAALRRAVYQVPADIQEAAGLSADGAGPAGAAGSAAPERRS